MVPGLVNLDFADIKTVMTNACQAIMGTGIGTGEDRGERAAKMALHSPLLEDLTIEGAKGILVNITGGEDLTLNDVKLVNETIYEAAGNSANIIFGAVIDNALKDKVFVTVIATGFGKKETSNDPGEEIDLFGGTPSKNRIRAKRTRAPRPILQKISASDYTPEDYQIPTYLRNNDN